MDTTADASRRLARPLRRGVGSKGGDRLVVGAVVDQRDAPVPVVAPVERDGDRAALKAAQTQGRRDAA